MVFMLGIAACDFAPPAAPSAASAPLAEAPADGGTRAAPSQQSPDRAEDEPKGSDGSRDVDRAAPDDQNVEQEASVAPVAADESTGAEPADSGSAEDPASNLGAKAPSNGFPDASNTGVPSGVDLQKSGSIKVTKAGTVVDLKDVSGQITVAADNVTIRRTRVRTNGAKYAVQVKSGVNGTVVEDVDLIGTDNNASVGIVYGNYTIRRADIRGFVDGPRLGSNTVVQDSYVHDTRKFSGTHNDAVQALGGTNIKLIGNTLEGPYRQSTSAALLSANWSPLRNVVIRGNKLSGGGYTLYVQRKDGAGQPAPSNIKVEDNVWVKNSWQYGPHTIAPGADITWRNNRLHTGEVLAR